MVSTQDSRVKSPTPVIPNTGGLATQKPERETDFRDGETGRAGTGCVDQLLLTGGRRGDESEGSQSCVDRKLLQNKHYEIFWIRVKNIHSVTWKDR